jgi:hypothetical protein
MPRSLPHGTTSSVRGGSGLGIDRRRIDVVRDLVDPTLGDASEQTYFAVATEQAVGLPQAAITST